MTDSEILKNEEKPVVWDEPREGILLREGDLALTLHKGQFHFIPVGKGEEYVAGKGVFGLRMKGWYTPWFLKLYLDGPVGRLFLETMRSGETYTFPCPAFFVCLFLYRIDRKWKISRKTLQRQFPDWQRQSRTGAESKENR